MQIPTLLCVLVAFVGEVAAIVLLTLGHDSTTLSLVNGCAAVATICAASMLFTQPPSRMAASPESATASPPIESLKEQSQTAIRLDGEPLDNKPWLKLVEENIELFDELDRQLGDFDSPRQEVADHVICRLQEILERCGVEVITGNGNFDRNRHQPDQATRVLPGAEVAQTLSPGFRVGNRVFRRARVQIKT